ncbi:hypothetical protein GO755_20750 [Spirosoma sp. HMF4905]|uniref:Uncharacterized protein n=1 Tax=Spirosoma arboris TaxID=2682092 RepID=A0A7K1SFH7_9BACT|nr:hypothetical protein [Spirosoma arboris]MVM32484.1 hypothetical protein [Spirosoma arboris]
MEKSSEWLAMELQFEALAQAVPSRTVLALLYLEHGGDVVDDEALDLYNERIKRFDGIVP